MSYQKQSLIFFAAVSTALFIFPHLFLVFGGYFEWIMPNPREVGYVENATALFFLIAGAWAIKIAYSVKPAPAPFFLATLIAFGVLAIWVCLEETSYGQQLVHFNTPEWFLERNKNLEVNIHNLYGDTVSYAMKTAGYVGVSLAGIIIPLVIKRKGLTFDRSEWFYYFLPSTVMIVPSLFHLFANLPKQAMKTFGYTDVVEQHAYFSEAGEYEEYMLGVWVILFVVMVRQRVKTDDVNSKE